MHNECTFCRLISAVTENVQARVQGSAWTAGQQAGHRDDGGLLDGGAESGFGPVAVAVPGGAPDPVQPPAEAAQYLLAQPVPVAGGAGRMVLIAVAFHAEAEGPRLARVLHPDVDPVPGGPHLE